MRALRIELRTPPAAAVQRGWAAGLMALAIALAIVLVLGLAVWQGVRSLQLNRQLQQAAGKAQAARLQLDARHLPPPPSSPASAPPFTADALQLAQRAAFNAAHVLDAVEAVRVPGVQLLALDITAADRGARAELAFRDAAALDAYLDALNASDLPPRWRWSRLSTPASSTATPVAGAAGGGQATIEARAWVPEP